MRYLFSTILLCLFVVSTSFTQSREQSIEQLMSFKEQIKSIEQNILTAEKTDIENAKAQNFNVFRILPRETFNNSWSSIRGGGAYYSFTKKSHSIDETPQIELQQNNLSVGFGGADYGFISDLGEITLESVDKEIASVKFLVDYKPPTIESLARVEQKNSSNFLNNGVKYQRSIQAIIGHTYILRAISYERADTLVAFNINRKDSDGSLIIFWKPIQQFEKTVLLRQTDEELSQKIEKVLQENKFTDVVYEVNQGIVALSGSLPRLNEVLKLISSTGPRGFILKYSEK